MNCPHCGAATPAGARFCMGCGADLTKAAAWVTGPQRVVTGKGGTPERPKRRMGCVRWVVLAIGFIVLLGALANIVSPTKGGPATPTPATIAQNTNAQPATETPIAAKQAPTDIPLPSDTPAATATAAPDPAKQADLRIFIGKVLGIQQPCLDAADSANISFAAAAKGGDSVQAYQDAQAAQAACDATKSAAASLTAPDSLSEYKLGDVQTDLFTWATDMGNVLNDYKKLLQNNNDVEAAADAKTMLKEVNFMNTLGAGLMAEAALALQVPIASITPVVPQ